MLVFGGFILRRQDMVPLDLPYHGETVDDMFAAPTGVPELVSMISGTCWADILSSALLFVLLFLPHPRCRHRCSPLSSLPL